MWAVSLSSGRFVAACTSRCPSRPGPMGAATVMATPRRGPPGHLASVAATRGGSARRRSELRRLETCVDRGPAPAPPRGSPITDSHDSCVFEGGGSRGEGVIRPRGCRRNSLAATSRRAGGPGPPSHTLPPSWEGGSPAHPPQPRSLFLVTLFASRPCSRSSLPALAASPPRPPSAGPGVRPPPPLPQLPPSLSLSPHPYLRLPSGTCFSIIRTIWRCSC